MRELLRYLTTALEEGRELILCQVVDTRGSTPQKAGAMMVVDPNGGQSGTLGGGCVEAEVKQKAIRGLDRDGAELHTFVLDHDYAWADGLICGGKMVITTETLRGPIALAYLRSYRDLLEAGEGFTEAIVTDPVKVGLGETFLGGRFLFGPEGAFVSSRPSTESNPVVADQVRPLHDRPRAEVRGGVAFLPTLPRIRLMIVGAGHVGQAVAELATRADFDVWVIDDRDQYASSERFPTAQKRIIGPIDEVLPGLEVTPSTYALIVTRGHGHDQEALFHLAPTAASYVGLIGSRRKIKLIFESLRQAGVSAAALERVTAPVGFDIGSQTVPEIAVSIVAELIARRNLGPSALGPRERTRPSAAPSSCEVVPTSKPVAQ
jgi:xanthine dehydrogenase accessory factor